MQKTPFPAFISALEMKLQKPLPGLAAQLQMASTRLLEKLKSLNIPDHTNLAGVLVLMYPHAGDIMIVLIKRTNDGGVHSGQISFPGGRVENSDPDIIRTALRETFEETGIPAGLITPLGKLSELYIPPSNYKVTPVVGYMESEPIYHPDPAEVEKIIEVSLFELLQEDIFKKKTINTRGVELEVPCFTIDEHVIWGATAMILSELIEVIRS